jgi:hypothetical protein
MINKQAEYYETTGDNLTDLNEKAKSYKAAENALLANNTNTPEEWEAYKRINLKALNCYEKMYNKELTKC